MLMNMSFLVNSIFFPIIHKYQSLLKCLNLLLCETHYINTKVCITDYFQVLIVFVEQIINSLIVNFKIRNPYIELGFAFLGLLLRMLALNLNLLTCSIPLKMSLIAQGKTPGELSFPSMVKVLPDVV